MQIVAGLEPENTNVFLQMLGKAAQKGDGAAFVPVRVIQTARAGRAKERCSDGVEFGRRHRRVTTQFMPVGVQQ